MIPLDFIERHKEQLCEFYVSQYALKQGVFKITGTVHIGTIVSYILTKDVKSPSQFFSAKSKNIWLTKEEAIADAERRRKSELAKLEDKICKLKAINFHDAI